MHDVVSNPAAATAASFADWNKKSRGLGRRRDGERGEGAEMFQYRHLADVFGDASLHGR